MSVIQPASLSFAVNNRPFWAGASGPVSVIGDGADAYNDANVAPVAELT
jgi:hypothetical protein